MWVATGFHVPLIVCCADTLAHPEVIFHVSSEMLQDWIGFVNTRDYLSDEGFLSPSYAYENKKGGQERENKPLCTR